MLIFAAIAAFGIASLIQAAYEAPSGAFFLAVVAIVLILVGDLLDFEFYDDVLRVVLVIIGWIFLAAVAGLFLMGEPIIGFAALVILWIVMVACQPMFISFLPCGTRQDGDLSSKWIRRATACTDDSNIGLRKGSAIASKMMTTGL